MSKAPVFYNEIQEEEIQQVLDKYIEEFECNGNADNMFTINVPRRVIIPQPLEE